LPRHFIRLRQRRRTAAVKLATQILKEVRIVGARIGAQEAFNVNVMVAVCTGAEHLPGQELLPVGYLLLSEAVRA
jgi:hypothetical protein